MTFADDRALLEALLELRGKIVFTVGADLSPALRRERGAEIVRAENLELRENVFGNVSETLAAAGTPWDAARERIARELRFWFDLPDESAADAFSATPAENLDAATRARLAFARALAAKPAGAPLAVAPSVPALDPQIFVALKTRAEAENFSVFVADAPHENFRDADLLAFFAGTPDEASANVPAAADAVPADAGPPVLCTPREAFFAPETLPVAQRAHFLKSASRRGEFCFANVVSGTVLGAGAGEFLATVPAGEIHGRLCGNVPEPVPENARIDVFLAPEIFHLDAFPPEENFFEVDSGEEIFFDGALFLRRFATKDGTRALLVAAQHRQSLEIPEGGSLFAWFFPEDALGFLR